MDIKKIIEMLSALPAEQLQQVLSAVNPPKVDTNGKYSIYANYFPDTNIVSLYGLLKKKPYNFFPAHLVAILAAKDSLLAFVDTHKAEIDAATLAFQAKVGNGKVTASGRVHIN